MTWHKPLLFGAWAYKVQGKVDYSKPFPNTNSKHIDMKPGSYISLKQLSKDLLDSWKEMGATHIMLCDGTEKAKVIEV